MNKDKFVINFTDHKYLHSKPPSTLLLNYSAPVAIVYGFIWLLCKPKGFCTITHKAIERMIGINRNTAGKALEILVNNGHLVDLEPYEKENQTRVLGIPEIWSQENEVNMETLVELHLSHGSYQEINFGDTVITLVPEANKQIVFFSERIAGEVLEEKEIEILDQEIFNRKQQIIDELRSFLANHFSIEQEVVVPVNVWIGSELMDVVIYDANNIYWAIFEDGVMVGNRDYFKLLLFVMTKIDGISSGEVNNTVSLVKDLSSALSDLRKDERIHQENNALSE
jgi:hypothetical protein